MWRRTALTERLHLELPIVAAPMAGGPTTAGLAAAVCEAGGLGVLAGGYRDAEAIDVMIGELRATTRRPFGVNLLVPQARPPSADPRVLSRLVDMLAPFAEDLGMAWPPDPIPSAVAENFDTQMEVVLDNNVPFFSFTFGIPSPTLMTALRKGGTLIAGTATSVEEAQALAAAGTDFVCLQGKEAGGHRGTFLGRPEDSMTPTFELLRAVRAEVDVPVIAAGGIMDGRAAAGAIRAGAAGAQLGTAFLLCPEAATSMPYRRAVAGSRGTDTVITKALSGKPARGISNRITAALEGMDLPPYPVMNSLTRELRRRAAERDDERYLSLWAGEGVGEATAVSAGELVARLSAQADLADGDVKD